MESMRGCTKLKQSATTSRGESIPEYNMRSPECDFRFEVTDKALAYARKLLEGSQYIGFRIKSVKAGVRWTYEMSLVEDRMGDEELIRSQGIAFYMNQRTRLLLMSAKIDFSENLMSYGFVISQRSPWRVGERDS